MKLSKEARGLAARLGTIFNLRSMRSIEPQYKRLGSGSREYLQSTGLRSARNWIISGGHRRERRRLLSEAAETQLHAARRTGTTIGEHSSRAPAGMLGRY
jgi:hypothetical protein